MSAQEVLPQLGQDELLFFCKTVVLEPLTATSVLMQELSEIKGYNVFLRSLSCHLAPMAISKDMVLARHGTQCDRMYVVMKGLIGARLYSYHELKRNKRIVDPLKRISKNLPMSRALSSRISMPHAHSVRPLSQRVSRHPEVDLKINMTGTQSHVHKTKKEYAYFLLPGATIGLLDCLSDRRWSADMIVKKNGYLFTLTEDKLWELIKEHDRLISELSETSLERPPQPVGQFLYDYAKGKYDLLCGMRVLPTKEKAFRAPDEASVQELQRGIETLQGAMQSLTTEITRVYTTPVPGRRKSSFNVPLDPARDNVPVKIPKKSIP